MHCKLDKVYLRNPKGAYIRLRAKGIEIRERSTSYFCHLEKRRQERNLVKALRFNRQITTDPKIKYYSKQNSD